MSVLRICYVLREVSTFCASCISCACILLQKGAIDFVLHFESSAHLNFTIVQRKRDANHLKLRVGQFSTRILLCKVAFYSCTVLKARKLTDTACGLNFDTDVIVCTDQFIDCWNWLVQKHLRSFCALCVMYFRALLIICTTIFSFSVQNARSKLLQWW